METNNLEQLVEELKDVIPFKPTTGVGDLVLIASEEPRLMIYGLVSSIERDPIQKRRVVAHWSDLSDRTVAECHLDPAHRPDDRSGNIHHGRGKEVL